MYWIKSLNNTDSIHKRTIALFIFLVNHPHTEHPLLKLKDNAYYLKSGSLRIQTKSDTEKERRSSYDRGPCTNPHTNKGSPSGRTRPRNDISRFGGIDGCLYQYATTRIGDPQHTTARTRAIGRPSAPIWRRGEHC